MLSPLNEFKALIQPSSPSMCKRLGVSRQKRLFLVLQFEGKGCEVGLVWLGYGLQVRAVCMTQGCVGYIGHTNGCILPSMSQLCLLALVVLTTVLLLLPYNGNIFHIEGSLF